MTAAVAFVYQVLALFEVVPVVSQNEVINIITILVTMLAGLGIVVDPTTNGISDSERALTYDEPKITEDPQHAKEL